ncbi:MAG: UDP-galactopyranose mutase [Pseudomonadota bacterium]
MRFNWVVVGAGFTGLTFAHQKACQGKSVLVVEQRDHIGGNAWDEYNEVGVLDHIYGPHIFHTNSNSVVNFLSRFTEWRPYTHFVRAEIEGKLVPIPFNLNSIDLVFGDPLASTLRGVLVDEYGYGSRVPILKLRQHERPEIKFLADFVYKNVFEGYTRKQWGVAPEDLAPSVTARVPVSVSRDDRYFGDRYQIMPKRGYAHLFRKMADVPGLKVLLKTTWQSIKSDIETDNILFTGPIDEFFEYKFGDLPYRSLRFEREHTTREVNWRHSVTNFPNSLNCTRTTSMRALSGQKAEFNTLISEYPEGYKRGSNIPYYPVPNDANQDLYRRYKELAERQKTTLFAGRLAEYQYYNMDQAVARALMLAEKY